MPRYFTEDMQIIMNVLFIIILFQPKILRRVVTFISHRFVRTVTVFILPRMSYVGLEQVWKNHGKYNEFIYKHQHNSLFVNLSIASELNWKEKGI